MVWGNGEVASPTRDAGDESSIFREEIVNRSLLLVIHNAGREGKQQMPGLKNLTCHRFASFGK